MVAVVPLFSDNRTVIDCSHDTYVGVICVGVGVGCVKSVEQVDAESTFVLD